MLVDFFQFIVLLLHNGHHLNVGAHTQINPVYHLQLKYWTQQ